MLLATARYRESHKKVRMSLKRRLACENLNPAQTHAQLRLQPTLKTIRGHRASSGYVLCRDHAKLGPLICRESAKIWLKAGFRAFVFHARRGHAGRFLRPSRGLFQPRGSAVVTQGENRDDSALV